MSGTIINRNGSAPAVTQVVIACVIRVYIGDSLVSLVVRIGKNSRSVVVVVVVVVVVRVAVAAVVVVVLGGGGGGV